MGEACTFTVWLGKDDSGILWAGHMGRQPDWVVSRGTPIQTDNLVGGWGLGRDSKD